MLRHIAIAMAAVFAAEGILYFVINRNLDAGLYPPEADSIGIPIISSLIPASIIVALLIAGIICRMASKWFALLSSFLFLVAAAIAGLIALDWAIPNHYLIAGSYSIITIGATIAAYNTFRGRASNRVAGGFSPPAPTPPGMRVRTGRFT